MDEYNARYQAYRPTVGSAPTTPTYHPAGTATPPPVAATAPPQQPIHKPAPPPEPVPTAAPAAPGGEGIFARFGAVGEFIEEHMTILLLVIAGIVAYLWLNSKEGGIQGVLGGFLGKS